MKRPRVMSVDGRRMVDPTAMEAYCIGAESTINELEARLTEAEGLLKDATAFMHDLHTGRFGVAVNALYQTKRIDAFLTHTKEGT